VHVAIEEIILITRPGGIREPVQRLKRTEPHAFFQADRRRQILTVILVVRRLLDSLYEGAVAYSW